MSEGLVLRVRVDRDRCQGHSQCCCLAPELFQTDAHGCSTEVGDGWVPPGLDSKAHLAAAACPEHAIQLSHHASPRVEEPTRG